MTLSGPSLRRRGERRRRGGSEKADIHSYHLPVVHQTVHACSSDLLRVHLVRLASFFSCSSRSWKQRKIICLSSPRARSACTSSTARDPHADAKSNQSVGRDTDGPPERLSRFDESALNSFQPCARCCSGGRVLHGAGVLGQSKALQSSIDSSSIVE
jgi:hypothetical protein